MRTAGIDIGSSTAKAVILEDRKILAYRIIPTGPDSLETAREVFREVLVGANLRPEDIENVVSTGYGRNLVSFGHKTVTEISCHARGAHWIFPEARTILDMGGQDCKAIACDERGDVVDFRLNDKCAAGTGRFLEIMAETMGLKIEEIGEISLEAENRVKINSVCTVFARSEALRLLRVGLRKKDVLAGLHDSICDRVLLILNSIGIKPDFVVTGGIAKNIGVIKRLEERIGLSIKIPDEPQIVGALGAALFASDILEGIKLDYKSA